MLVEQGAAGGRRGHPGARRGGGPARHARGRPRRPGAPARCSRVALSADLRADELAALEGAAALEDARRRRRCCASTATRVRVVAPAARRGRAASARAPRERRELHRALAGVVADAQLRALHLARATDRPDAELAASLSDAAAAAAARGARAAGRAARRARAAADAARVAGAATSGCSRSPRYLERAGEQQRLTDAARARGRARCRPARCAPAAGCCSARAPARGPFGTSSATSTSRWPSARDDAGVRAYVLAKKAALTASPARVDAHPRGRGVGARGARRRRRRARRRAAARCTRSAGRARSAARSIDDLCERSGAAADSSSYIADRAGAGRRPAARLARRARARAGDRSTRLLALADERGEPASYALHAAAPVRARAARRRLAGGAAPAGRVGASPPRATC